MACGIGSIYVSAVLQHVVINCLCVSRGAALIDLVGDDDVWGTAIGWRPTACSIKAGAKSAIYDCVVQVIAVVV